MADAIQIGDAMLHQRRRHHDHPSAGQKRLHNIVHVMHSTRDGQVRPELSEESSHPVQAQAQLMRVAQFQGRSDCALINVDVRLIKPVEKHQTFGSRQVQPPDQVRQRREVRTELHGHRDFDVCLDEAYQVAVSLLKVRAADLG